MNETFDEFNDLVEVMRRARRFPVPNRFVESVMTRLDAGEKTGTRECAACFFLTGFFYLVMGIMLTAGFRAIHFTAFPENWITLQPYLTIGASLLLFALGAALMKRGKSALKAAFHGTILYIFLVVISGIFMAPYLDIPYAGLFIAGFTGAGVFMGVIIARAVRKAESGVLHENNDTNRKPTKNQRRIFAH